MLDATEIAIFAALGVAFAIALVVLAHWAQKSAPRIAAYALIAVAFLYVGLALRSDNPGAWLGVEMTGVAIFGSLAMLSIIGAPWFVILGLLSQAAWAVQFHYIGSGSAFTPPAIAIANASFCVAIALYCLVDALRARSARPAPAPQNRKDRAR